MEIIYKVNQKPKFGQLIIFALQQLLAILAATIAVPAIVGNGMSTSAALFGAGAGTIIYLLFTKLIFLLGGETSNFKTSLNIAKMRN